MRSSKGSLAFVLLGVFHGVSIAQELQPYDRLGRGNVTLVASVVSGGSSMEEQTLKTSYGTYTKDMVNSKTVQVDVTLPNTDDPPVKMEAYVFIKARGSSRVRYQPAEVRPMEKLNSYTFDMTVKYSKERWMYADAGKVTETGDKVAGWIVRAIADSRIVGIAFSSESYRTIAANPDSLEKFELVAQKN